MNKKISNELKKLANPKQAKLLSGFFKTAKGEYGEAEELLHSKRHEERLCALLILVDKYENKKTTEKEKKEIVDFYLSNTNWVNNWDLVDLSSHRIIGEYLFNHPNEKEIIYKLAKSPLLWDKRISIISTFYLINKKQFEDSIKIAELLLNEEHDLMHKAVGWMLREVGKRDLKIEEKFLQKHYKKMPRTMLRYAIEKFPEEKRKKYLQGKI
jgi:3-methyladenine DNA glycosylase AlkD